MTLKEEYSRLAADIKEHITQEYASGEWIGSDTETYSYFKQYAMQNKQSAQQVKPVQVSQPAAPVKNVVHTVIKAPTTIPAPVEKKPEPLKANIPHEIKKPPEVKIEEKQPQAKSGFQLAPMAPVSAHDLSDMRKIVQEVQPSFAIIDKIPSNTPEVMIVVQEESPFITHLARAIDILLAPTAIVRNVPQSNSFKLVITTQPLDIPHLLVDPALYLSDPSQKIQLWKDINKLLTTN